MRIAGLRDGLVVVLVATLESLLILLLVANHPMGPSVKPVSATTGQEHCYADIGCFPLTPEFYHPRHRPFNVYPWHRSRIRIQFELFNRHHPDGLILRPWNRINLRHSGFNPLLETKIIIPGWLDHLRRTIWVQKMRDALLWLWGPVNIIIVHWRNFTPYTIATANTRVVGAQLANMLMWLERELHYDRAYHHLIGHSLGAHIAGYCGDRLPGLGRITALDPARPFFQHMPKSVRLDRGDARFIDAIHSDFTPENAILLLMSYGMTTPVGHLDFYPNGPPLLQPGCLRDTILSAQNGVQKGLQKGSLSIAFLETIRYLTACDHQRSHEWFIESITNRQCMFVGLRCNNYEGLINGRCACDDSRSACAVMGIHADQMYLNNAHEDLWPARHRRPHYAPTQRPLSRLPLNHLPLVANPEVPETRDQIYSRLKQAAHQLRRPPLDRPLPVEQLIEQELGSIQQDAMFIDYLKGANLKLAANAHDAGLEDKQDSGVAKRRQDGHFTTMLSDPNEDDAYPIARHPKLLSNLDEDIESWYEGASRWHLKTNHRPSYCVNQYQVLVFIGPLRSTSGVRRLRANLVISIIGSRGQLINQRFVPRSSQLDSFTMQPFFILLEGSYSLGNILSVAIGWEQRLDPDPIQATVAFKSPLLEQVQRLVPAYKAQHPFLSETLEYDHSDGFQWNRPSVGSHGRPHARTSSSDSDAAEESPAKREDAEQQQPKQPKVDKRSDELERLVEEAFGEEGADSSCSASSLSKNCASRRSSQLPPQRANKTRVNEAKEAEELSAMVGQVEQLLAGESRLLEVANDLYDEQDTRLAELTLLDPLVGAAALSGHLLHQPAHEQVQAAVAAIELQNKQNELLEALNDYHHGDDGVTAKLHNIPVHLDADLEDSIVVSQVQVNPIAATYGKGGARTGKLFCPPQPGQRLRRDQTIRLSPSLFGDCRHQHTRLEMEDPTESLIQLY